MVAPEAEYHAFGENLLFCLGVRVPVTLMKNNIPTSHNLTVPSLDDANIFFSKRKKTENIRLE